MTTTVRDDRWASVILGVVAMLAVAPAVAEDRDPSRALAFVRIEGTIPGVIELNQTTVLPKSRDPRAGLRPGDVSLRVFTLTSTVAADPPVEHWRTTIPWAFLIGEMTADIASDGTVVDIVVARSFLDTAEIWAWRVDIRDPKATRQLFAKRVQSTHDHDSHVAYVQPRIVKNTVRLTVLFEPDKKWGESLVLPP